MAFVLLLIAIAFTPFNSALAGTVKSDAANTAKQAATEVIKDTGVKEQFGKTENGERLLDKAQDRANQNLNDLATQSESNTDIPDSKKLFLKNLQGKS
jgi:hypothetical protein